MLEAAWSRQTSFNYVYSFMRIRHLGFFLIDLFSDYKTDGCRKGLLNIIKVLLVRSRGPGSPGLPVSHGTVMVRRQGDRVTGPGVDQ